MLGLATRQLLKPKVSEKRSSSLSKYNVLPMLFSTSYGVVGGVTLAVVVLSIKHFNKIIFMELGV